jgi:anaerobic selenocysteine-containing dehydrogenase
MTSGTRSRRSPFATRASPLEQLASETDGILLRPSGPIAEPIAGQPLGEELVIDGPEVDAADQAAVGDVEAQAHDMAAAAADDVEAVEAHHAAAAEAQAEAVGEAEALEAAEADPVLPAVIALAPTDRYESPAVDAYSLRLVTYRKLYDQGTLVQAAPSLAGLAAGGDIAANPADLDRLGVAVGDKVKLSSPRGTLTVAVTPDASVPEGTLAMAIGQGDPSPTVLIDAAASVTDVRVETIA